MESRVLRLEDIDGMLKAEMQGRRSRSSMNAVAIIVIERIVGKFVREESAHDLLPLSLPQQRKEDRYVDG